jgi:hypothetical protein
MPQPGKPQPVSTGTVRFVRIVKVAIQENRAPRTVVHCALENSGWYSRSARHLRPFATTNHCFPSHLWLPARVIRIFCQLEQYPHQLRVIQRLLAAEEPISNKAVHRRLGSAKFARSRANDRHRIELWIQKVGRLRHDLQPSRRAGGDGSGIAERRYAGLAMQQFARVLLFPGSFASSCWFAPIYRDMGGGCDRTASLCPNWRQASSSLYEPSVAALFGFCKRS